MSEIKVLIIDHSKFARVIFSGLLSESKDIKIVGTAGDMDESITLFKNQKPDVILIDLEMTNMDSISFIEKILRLRQLPIVVSSSLSSQGADLAIKALELGAIDCIAKPNNAEFYKQFKEVAKELKTKIKAAARSKVVVCKEENVQYNLACSLTWKFDANKIIAIGASTGGIEAIKEILYSLPINCPPVLISQHIPEKFTESLVNRLNSIASPAVHIAKNGMEIKPGHIYVAPGGVSMLVKGNLSTKALVELVANETGNHTTSISSMFESVAENFKENAVGIILTGAGEDGINGIAQMKKSGAYTIGQNAETCVIYDMPKAAKEKNILDIELPIEMIANQALEVCSASGFKQRVNG